MKPTLTKLILLFSLFIAGQTQVFAEGGSHASRVGEKLAVGIANVSTGFVELPKTMIASSKSNGIAYGMTAGLMTGIGHTVGRTLFGALDLVTFMIPTKAMVTPEYVWNNFNKETTYNTNWQMRK